ncbi:Stp1/IreP family PP2C-type Ser/Thr phosphatase [Virgibacillus sp. NKC19-16]|uniref:Stp1/IreP family PP2C-type Ser/Thr phosphatase n=1 Tax=Virgibacillus salidurans TaxID=2831673 RepID=UPI001F3D09CF|nr:Stp1/IreP family PP2C-type Ser/Thr phosphatase [Virgibacillus sp. NKC19-16]UJL47893.1 Stp1/IreP family PP2C-type Ser/Thr phosphatase [Virgibacillus sp. NKC19-16]
MKGQFLTDRGKVRNYNEDAGGVFYNSFGQLLAIIADGMGGHQAGDVASQMAISLIEEKWENGHQLDSAEEAEQWISQAIIEVNESIYTHALQKTEYEGMGTTVVASICTDEFITISHIGDSRCYLFSESVLNQITEDHSLVNELVRSGQISKDDAEQHPRKNVLLRALGTEENAIAETQSIEWVFGDKLLLCSDGLTNKVSDEELASFMNSSSDIKETGKQMVELANERGGEDNISLLIVCHDPALKEGETSC